MFRTIGSFLDCFIFIGAGIFLFTQLKKINKPYIKWVGVILILVGIILFIFHIVDIINQK
jgi:membrane protein DedA with SNARE-associated domain